MLWQPLTFLLFAAVAAQGKIPKTQTIWRAAAVGPSTSLNRRVNAIAKTASRPAEAAAETDLRFQKYRATIEAVAVSVMVEGQ